MTMHPTQQLIEERLLAAFSPARLEVLDDSDQHIGHAGHQGGGRHFTIIIQSHAFDGCARVLAHRKIYALFQDVIPERIHALRIQIISS